MKLSARHRLGTKVILVFLLVFGLYYIVHLAVGVGPNWILRRLGATDELRLTISMTLGSFVRLAAVILLSAWALRWILGLDPSGCPSPSIFPGTFSRTRCLISMEGAPRSSLVP